MNEQTRQNKPAPPIKKPDQDSQQPVDASVREKIKVGLVDESAGRYSEFDANDIKKRGRIRLRKHRRTNQKY